MRETLLDILRCPVDRRALALQDGGPLQAGHFMEGRLVCVQCGAEYAVRDGVPDMLPHSGAVVAGVDLGGLQAATVNRFGFEWQYFKDWGWLESYPAVPNAEERFFGGLLEHSRTAFWSKSLFDPDDVKPGTMILDAGCGNGRFSFQAAQGGATVVGIDLGAGVYSAFGHTRHLANVHIVRGDLFRLPFADAIFDRVFSIGVLMHTGNAQGAFDSLVRTLASGGEIVAHVYGQGRRTYEVGDCMIRAVTTRLPIGAQMAFARACAGLARRLRNGFKRRLAFYWRLYSHVNLLPTEHHMFDWWSAPVASHHLPDEVCGWFRSKGLDIIRTNPPEGDRAAEESRRRNHGAITVLGRKPDR